MDMFTDVQNQTNNYSNNNQISVPEGFTQVSQDEFLRAVLAQEDSSKITEALISLMNHTKEMNDKRYTSIITGRVENIKDDGNITVQMIGDDSEVVETHGYMNQTPFALNQNDYVKVCKQTAGDKINSWIIGVNNVHNKRDAFMFLELCINCISMLQEEIKDIKSSIQTLTEAYISTTEKVTVGTNTVSVPTIKINSGKIKNTLNILKKLNTVDNNVRLIKNELETINQGKVNNI